MAACYQYIRDVSMSGNVNKEIVPANSGLSGRWFLHMSTGSHPSVHGFMDPLMHLRRASYVRYVPLTMQQCCIGMRWDIHTRWVFLYMHSHGVGKGMLYTIQQGEITEKNSSIQTPMPDPDRLLVPQVISVPYRSGTKTVSSTQ